MPFIELLALIGLLLSAYGLFVERQLKRHPFYKARCDINKYISCTKAFGSEYGHLSGAPNPLLGIIFYLLIIILALLGQSRIIFYLAILGVLGALLLAYISYVQQRNFCLVCTGIYVVNILLLLMSL